MENCTQKEPTSRPTFDEVITQLCSCMVWTLDSAKGREEERKAAGVEKAREAQGLERGAAAGQVVAPQGARAEGASGSAGTVAAPPGAGEAAAPAAQGDVAAAAAMTAVGPSDSPAAPAPGLVSGTAHPPVPPSAAPGSQTADTRELGTGAPPGARTQAAAGGSRVGAGGVGEGGARPSRAELELMLGSAAQLYSTLLEGEYTRYHVEVTEDVVRHMNFLCSGVMSEEYTQGQPTNPVSTNPVLEL